MSNVLSRHFEEKKSKNNKFSIRAYANFIGISPASLSHILKGRRTLPLSQIDNVSLRLKLSEEERNELAYSVLNSKNKIQKRINIKKARSVICEKTYSKLIRKWEYYLILTCFNLSDFERSFEWISNKSGLPQKRVYGILLDLLSLGIIESDMGFFKLVVGFHETLPGISSDIIVNGHKDNLSKASESLRYSPNLREFQYITLPTNVKNLQKAKVLINTFIDEMEALLEDGEKTEVYRLAVQLFPLK